MVCPLFLWRGDVNVRVKDGFGLSGKTNFTLYPMTDIV